MADVFRVGITPDWGDRLDSIMGAALREVFDPIPDLEWEIMPANPEITARPEVIDRYDAMAVLAYYYKPESFQGLERLKCLARWGVGYDRIDVPSCTAADVCLAITPTTIRRSVSEGALALIFAIGKNLLPMDKNVRAGRWRQGVGYDGVFIRDRVLGSLGLGNISGELFRMARGLGFSKLIAHDPYAKPEVPAELGVELVDLDTLLRESDFLSLHAPMTPATDKIINAENLAKMKRSAYLINTARGGLVDEDALLAALKERRIAGAALDVLEEEPPPADHPFFELENVILTPHWVPMTAENVAGNSLELCNNILAIYRGEAPPFLVNPEVKDRPGFQAKLAARR